VLNPGGTVPQAAHVQRSVRLASRVVTLVVVVCAVIVALAAGVAYV